jgi:hypothetical protein
MAVLCWLVALFATTPAHLTVTPGAPPPPAWAVEEWEGTAPALADIYAERLGTPPGTLRLAVAHASREPGRLDLRAVTTPRMISVTLAGRGWDEPSDSGRRTLRLNLAHELAHHWQLQSRRWAYEPLHLHEGFAEALGIEAMGAAGLWSRAEADAYRDDLADRCATVLATGPLSVRLARQDREAANACGYVLIEGALAASGRSASAAFTLYQTTPGSRLGPLLWEEAGPSFLADANEFVRADYSRADTTAIVRAFRAGRL